MGTSTFKKKSAQLGMSFHAASRKLWNMVIFDLAQKAGFDVCFHCGEKIKFGQLSLEHKIAWQDTATPTELFWDMNNISFSHLRCNLRAARKVNLFQKGHVHLKKRGKAKLGCSSNG